MEEKGDEGMERTREQEPVINLAMKSITRDKKKKKVHKI